MVCIVWWFSGDMTMLIVAKSKSKLPRYVAGMFKIFRCK